MLKLSKVLQRKGIVLLNDNACPHAANQTQDLIGSFVWELLDHSPYSPDVLPSSAFEDESRWSALL
jgi:hypothetical protein